MPTSASGARHAGRSARGRRDRREGLAERPSGARPPGRARSARCMRTAPTSTLNRSSTRVPAPNVNCVLPPPVSNTTSEPSPETAARPSPRRYARRLSSSPEIDLDPRRRCAPGSRRRPRPLLRGDPQAGGADRGDRADAVPRSPRRPCRRSRSTVRSSASGRDDAVVAEALAESRDLGPVDDRAPRPVGVALADVELDRVGPDVDDGVARSRAVDERGEPDRVARVEVLSPSPMS